MAYALTLHDVFYVQDSRQCNSVKTSSHHELYIWSIYIKLSQPHLQRRGKGTKSVLVHMWKNTFAIQSEQNLRSYNINENLEERWRRDADINLKNVYNFDKLIKEEVNR